MNEEIINELKKLDIGKLEVNTSIKKYNTYKIGGNVRVLAFPKNIESLIKLLKYIRTNNLKYKIIGNGSNLIFSSKEFDGVLIKLSEFNNLEIKGNKIIVGAGYELIKLSRVALKNSLTGLEFASGIPGSVGGAVFMNAGAYKSDMGYIVQSVKTLTPDYRVVELENKELNFHYRTSFFKTHPDYICLGVILKLVKGNKKNIEEVMKSRLKRRVESQPLEYPSAGSVFRNPPDMFAGELIENAGLKGMKIGGAMVSDKHANFIINKNNATGEDVRELIKYVKDKVYEKYNVELKEEQEYVNWE